MGAGLGVIQHTNTISPAANACGNELKVSPGVVRDAAAIEAGYRKFAETRNLFGDPIIPRTVGHNGAVNGTHERDVPRMIGCMADKYQLNSGVRSELIGMYRDSVEAEKIAHRNGVHTHR